MEPSPGSAAGAPVRRRFCAGAMRSRPPHARRASPPPRRRPNARPEARPRPVRGIPGPLRSLFKAGSRSFRTPSPGPDAFAVFEYLPPRASSPQIWGDFPLHSLGIQKLSILLPQQSLPMLHQPRSQAWGFVANSDPRPVEKIFAHRTLLLLSTDTPQLRTRCPQPTRASPHPCPLFGNATPLLTTPSERRHTKRGGWAVGNAGKTGDGSGEKPPCPVYPLCRTFACPQKCRVLHRGAHRGSGQKIGPDLRQRRYPRFPQALLLLPHRVSSESVSKQGLCTTRGRRSPDASPRLDPEQHRVSVPYVRLVSGVIPSSWTGGPIRCRRPAGRASNSRRRFR